MLATPAALSEIFTDIISVKYLCAFTSDEDQTIDDLKQHFLELAAYVEQLKQEGFQLEANPDPTWLQFSHTNRAVFEKYFHVWEDPEDEEV